MDDKDRERLAALFFATDPRVKEFLKDRGELRCGLCGEKREPRVIANEAQAEDVCEHRRESYWKVVDLAFKRDELGAKTEAFGRVDEMERLRAAGLRRREYPFLLRPHQVKSRERLEKNSAYGKRESKLHATANVKVDPDGSVRWSEAHGIHSVARVERGTFDVRFLEPLAEVRCGISCVVVDPSAFGFSTVSDQITNLVKRVKVRRLDGTCGASLVDVNFAFQAWDLKSGSSGPPAPLRETGAVHVDPPRVLGMGKSALDDVGLKLGDLVSSRARRISFPNDVGEIVGGGAHESQHGLVRVRWRSNGDLVWLPADGLRKTSE